MALILDPPDLIERAARNEHWTAADSQHCAKMLSEAFEGSFQVKQLQQVGDGLIAYDAPFSGLESVRLQTGANKPVLQAVEDLSTQLLRVKEQREK